MGDILEANMMEVGTGSMVLLPEERIFNLEYVDSVVLLCDNTQAMQFPLNELIINVRTHAVCFSFSKCRVFLQNLQDTIPPIILCGDLLEVVKARVFG